MTTAILMRLHLRRKCCCGCDEFFRPRHAAQKLKGVGCRGRWVTAKRVEAMARQRRRKFARILAEMFGDDRRLTQGQLVALCEDVYRRGYNAGWQHRTQRERRGLAA